MDEDDKDEEEVDDDDEEVDEEVHHQVLCSPIQKAPGERSLQFVFFVPPINPLQ